jgi:PKD repeat protein
MKGMKDRGGLHPPTKKRSSLFLGNVIAAVLILIFISSSLGVDIPPKEWVTVIQVESDHQIPPQEHLIIQRSSIINSYIAAYEDSPDIPVTTASNTTQSENSVFINPNNPQILLNSNNSSDWPVTQIYGADYFISLDGGQTWTGSVLGAGGPNRGDPAAAIDLNNRMFVGFIAMDYGQGIAYSDDNGANWTQVQVAPGPSMLDKNHLWVDNSTASPYADNLYSAWTNLQGASPNYGEIEIRRSTNNGLNWSSSINVSSAIGAGSHNQGVNIQTGPGGEVYVVWTVYDSWPSDETALGLAISGNGGQSYAPATRIITNIRGHRYTALGGGKTMRHNSFPSMSVNQQTGEVYVVWTNIGIPGVNTGDPDIYMISSTDGGSSWSTPTRVNQDTQGNGKDQWFPWISCDPVTGTLACIFHDSRNFAGNDMAETFVAVSTDNGATWEDFLVSDVAWSGDGIPGFSGNYAGDYLAIAVRNNEVYPMWGDDRSGNFLTYISPFSVSGGPVAEFSADATVGCVPFTVNFTDLSTGEITSWLWNFGDGDTSSVQNPAHTYLTTGTYTVSLTVSGPAGSDTETKIDYISVYDVPVADFSANQTNGCAPLTVEFTDLSTGDPDTWSWTFGDGGTSGDQNPTYTYENAGTYSVTLTTSNLCGSDGETKIDYIQVDPPCGVNAYALSDISVRGSVSGDYLDTHTSDNVYESITEVHSGGKPSNRYSVLEHKWDFNVVAGSSITFYVEGYRPDNSDGDDFSFEYSIDDNSYVPLVTINSATEQVYSAAIPNNISGNVYVRVIDTDHTAQNLSYDPVYVDHMYIESAGTPPPPDSMFVHSIDVVRIAQKGNRYRGQATVVIHNQDDQAVSGAAVSGHFSGPTSESVSGTTGTDGSVVFQSAKVKNPSGVWCFAVDDVSLGSNVYDPTRNVETSDCEAGGAPALSAAAAQSIQLLQNHPNPFNPTTEISFYLPNASHVSLVVYDVTGRRVATLANNYFEAGSYIHRWDASGVSSGIYFYRLEAGQTVKIRKMILVK